MARTAYRLVLGLGLALWPVPVTPAQREPPPLPPGLKPPAPLPMPAEEGRRESTPGAEVQARGPVHEAFAEPGTPPSAAPVVPKQPPAPIEELPPEQKPAGKQVQWIPGYYQWELKDFLWVSGCWRVSPPGKVWLPGRWQQVSGGWQWVSGCWVEEKRSEVELLPPPPAPREQEIPRLAPGQVYEPGCWVYREKGYAWRPGLQWTFPKAGSGSRPGTRGRPPAASSWRGTGTTRCASAACCSRRWSSAAKGPPGTSPVTSSVRSACS